MRITDELRVWNDETTILPITRRQLLDAIADRIDAEYQKAEDEWKAKGGQSWLHGYEECHLELMEGNETIAASLEEAGWYRVLDADKQPIRIGDELDSEHYEDGTVVGLQFFEVANGAPRVLIAIRPHGWDTPTWRDPLIFHHHHKPTIEDVLREFGEKYCDMVDGCAEESELFAEYAAKLQLRGDGE